MIQLLLVSRGVEMLVEPTLCGKLAVADVAFPVRAVEGKVRNLVLHTSVPSNQLVGDGAALIPLADHAVDGVAVETRCMGTASPLEVVGEPGGRGVACRAEGAGDGSAAVDFGVEVLPSQIFSLDTTLWIQTYHLQAILVLEEPITSLAVVPVMAQRCHMLIGGRLGVEHLRAFLAWNRRRPVPQRIHMLGCSIPRPELLGAGLTLESGSPMVCVVHVLVASFPGPEGLGTGLAFGPVVAVVHVLKQLIFIIERVVTAGAFIFIVHDG